MEGHSGKVARGRMIEILVPREDVNDDYVIVAKWLVGWATPVTRGEVICELETSKTVFQVCAPEDGILCPLAQEGDELSIGKRLAALTDSAVEVDILRVEPNLSLADVAARVLSRGEVSHPKAAKTVAPNEGGVPMDGAVANASGNSSATAGATIDAVTAISEGKHALSTSAGEVEGQAITVKARAFARERGIDLSQIRKPGIVTLADLQALLPKMPAHCQPPCGVQRVLVLGAGVAAMQVLDILLHDRHYVPVGCLDDNPALEGANLFGVPVRGPMARLDELWAEQAFDCAIVGVGTNLPVRRKLYRRLVEMGIPLASAIDPSARINRHAVVGQGVVLCSFVHVGVNAVVGDNCFLAAHCNVDHHCRLGETVLMGPGCLLSGGVRIGGDTLMGSGVIVQPCLAIGSECRIASGSVIIADVPEKHALKMRPNQELRKL